MAGDRGATRSVGSVSMNSDREGCGLGGNRGMTCRGMGGYRGATRAAERRGGGTTWSEGRGAMISGGEGWGVMVSAVKDRPSPVMAPCPYLDRR